MGTCRRSSLLCFLILLVISDSSNGLFFQYPRKALWNFLETLGGHKKEQHPVHHYHMHYYPVPVILPKPAPPPKIEIDLLHSGHGNLHSYGWANQDLGHYPDSEVGLSAAHAEPVWDSPAADPWTDASSLQQKSSWGWDGNNELLLEKDHTLKDVKPKGILLQVPLQQQIVLYQPPAKDKSSLLSTFLRKIRRINDALFHPEDDYQEPVVDNKPHISNSLTYAAASAH